MIHKRPTALHPGPPNPSGTNWLAAGIAAALLVVFVAETASSTAPPEIEVSLSRQTATVGDPVDLTLRLRYDTSMQIVAPVFGRTFGALEVLGDTVLSEGVIENGAKTYARRIRLVAFRPGSLWTPQVAGELVDSTGFVTSWQSDSLLLDIVSVIGQAGTDSIDIKALKAQYEMPESRWLYWAISGLLLAAVLAFWWWWRHRKKPVASKEVVPDAPSWETALHALEDMPVEIDPEADGGRQWYFRLSEILRRYLDERYNWSSMDETTSQILRRLPRAPFANGLRERAREFFLLADQIRYARSPARTGRPEVDRGWVRDFVEATIPSPVVIEPVPPGDFPGPDEEHQVTEVAA